MLNRMMFFKNQHERKSSIITFLMVVILLFMFSFVGLKYIDPPIEYGMEVNFGKNDNGKGLKALSNEVIVSETQQVKTKNNEKASEKQSKPISSPTKVASQEISESKIIKKKKIDSLKDINKNSKSTESIKKTKKQKVSEATKSIISNLIKTEDRQQKIDGEGKKDGFSDQGKYSGDPYSTVYYGKEGEGGKGLGYGLSGRNLQINGKKIQDCNESGIVVVRIIVNQMGEVVSAKPGVKGTTNNHPCLLAPAQKTALMHKWYPDSNAPEKQVGFVVIEFKLVE